MNPVEVTRKYLKNKLQRDTKTFIGFKDERASLLRLFKCTAKEGESNSALLIGNKKGGKTTLVNSVLFELLHDEVFVSNTIIISLNGLVHSDDRQALKSTTTQLNLDKEVEGKVFNSFSENLTFLLSCLKTGQESQRLIFIIDEFDLFCGHHNQTLLYNLFDVAQSAQTPICVLGITCRLDVVELLEKRVKSRFSHRQIVLLREKENHDDLLETFKDLLKLPSALELAEQEKHNILPDEVLATFKLPFLQRTVTNSNIEFPKKYALEWNKNVDLIVKNEKVVKSLENFFDDFASIAMLKLLLFQLVTKLDESHEKITADDVIKLTNHMVVDDNKVTLITGLSVLDICLLISIKHHCDIYDNDPFNFEIILTRYNKFAMRSTSMQNIDREIILKRFENLKHQEFISPVGTDGRVQKEYQMYRLLLFPDQIDNAVKKYHNLPTEVEQWCKSSFI